MDQETRDSYQMIDVNVYQENLFHTKMVLKEWELDNYLFGVSSKDLTEEQRAVIIDRLEWEMKEIFYGRNLPHIG